MTFVSYIINPESEEAEDWRAENGDGLCADFGIAAGEIAAELPRWHAALSGEPEEFAVLKRLYGIHPLLGVESVDDMRAWTPQEIASQRGETVAQIAERVTTAKTFWRRWKLQQPSADSSSGPAKNAGGSAKPERAELTDSEIKRLLLEHGFVSISDKDEREYIASRIRQLELWLESEQSRSATRAMIQSEVHLFFMMDRAIAGVQAVIRRKTTADPVQDITKENEQMMKLVKERQFAVAALEASMKALGMDDARGGGLRKKMNFQDTLTTCMEGMQQFYSDHSNDLIDRVFTGAEVELQLTPYTLRPAQYRPDVVCAAWEAMQHFWEREWKPTPVGRLAARRLKAGFDEGLKLIRSENNETISGMGEADEELEDAGETQASAMPSVVTTSPAPPMPPPPPAHDDDLVV